MELSVELLVRFCQSNCCDELIKYFQTNYEICPPKHGEFPMRAIRKGQCISFDALGLVRTSKIVLRGHLYGCQSACRETWSLASFYGFRAASGFGECKTSPPSNNSVLTSLFCADSNEQYDRRDNIRIFGLEEINDEDVYESVVEMANNIGVTISKQYISVSHHLPSTNQRSRPVICKVFWDLNVFHR